MKNFFTFLFSLAMLLFFATCNKKGEIKQMPYNEGINIIPEPKSLIQNEGWFQLNKNTCFYATTPELKKVAEFFADKIKTATGFTPEIRNSQGKKGGITLLIDNDLEVNEEGYRMEVSPEGVVIWAKTEQGAFYGMQSFMQLLPAEIENPTVIKNIEWKAPAVSIIDEPRFEYRGMHLDPCRHFIPVEYMKKHLDALSLFKINRMHWHLTDDQGWRIEIKKYPKLTEIGATRIEGEGTVHEGFYTQEEIKEIVQYAADRFITIVPEIELPGHALAAIAAYPELSCTGDTVTPRIIWGVEDIVFCAGKEHTFEFLENVIAEVAGLFPGEYIHLGGDECPKIRWEECPFCQKRIQEEKLKTDKEHTAEERLQSYFVQRMGKVVEKYGKKMIGWDEILEGGLAPSASVMSWRGEKGGIAAAVMGHDVVLTPNSNGMYIDHYQGDYKIEPVSIGGYSTLEKIYGYDPMPDTLQRIGKGHHIKGVQCNTWSEYMYTQEIREYRAYPRILALSEIAWSQPDRKDFSDFSRRINNALVRLDGHNIHYHIPQPEQPNGSCNFVAFTDQAVLEFKTTRPIKMVYTINGEEPTPESSEYTTPFEFSENTVLKIRSVLPSGKMSPTRTVTVEKQSLSPASEVAETTPGLAMKVLDGMFLNVDEMQKSAGVWKESSITSLREITQVVKTDESMRGVNQYAAIATGYVNIPEDGVYYISSDNEEVWIDGKRMINNGGEVKRFSRHDTSLALAKGLHEIKVVFLGHIIGGWPSNWNNGGVRLRHEKAKEFVEITPDMLRK